MKKFKVFIKKVFNKVWGWVKPYLTSRMIPILLVVWCCTNGVWYVFAFVDIGLPPAFVWTARTYLAFLYTPIGIEKPIILAVSAFIYRLIYHEKFKKKEKV